MLYRQIAATQGAAAATTAALALLQDNPAVDACGVSPDSTIWARFQCGLLTAIHEVERNDGDLAHSGSLPPAWRPDDGGVKGGCEATGAAVVMTAFAHEWGNDAELEAAGMIANCFGSAASSMQIYSDTQVTVSALAGVLASGPGVLLYSSHGCLVPLEPSGYWTALLTGETGSTLQMVDRLIDDYIEGATASGDALQFGVAVAKGQLYEMVTPAFVAAHASFDALEGVNNGCKSLVYVCCCYSGLIQNGLYQAFLEGGVDKFLGRSSVVDYDFAADALWRFFNQATDTCTVEEAYNTMGNLTIPGRAPGSRSSNHPTWNP